MNSSKIQNYLGLEDARLRFKKQSLKSKNVLFENEALQIGVKIEPLYDFYSSEYFLQINIFIGNKTDRPIEAFRLDYRGSPNLTCFLETKPKFILEKTQFRERLMVSCNNFEEEILLVVDFQCSLITLKSTVIPLSLWSFCVFTAPQPLPQILSAAQVLSILSRKFQYTEDTQITLNPNIFKKDVTAELQKYFTPMAQVCQGVFLAQFILRDFLQDYTLLFEITGEKSVKVTLCSNEYNYFDPLISGLKGLLE